MMIELRVTTNIPLVEPDADAGLVTWLEVEIVRLDDDEEASIGSARVALIHHGETANVGESIADVLDADSSELEALSDAIFDIDQNWIREPYDHGHGSNVLYVAELEVQPRWQGRSIEQAAVRRLSETVGDGCAIVVVPYNDVRTIEPWKKISFTVASEPTAAGPGYLVLDVTLRQPKIVPADEDEDGFRVLSNPAPGEKRRHH